jgi:hypothetical protein
MRSVAIDISTGRKMQKLLKLSVQPLCVAAVLTVTLGSLLPSVAAAGDVGMVDVAGLECRLAFETTRDEQVVPPATPGYLYAILQAPPSKRDSIETVLQFVSAQAEPEALINPHMGSVSRDANGMLAFKTSMDTVEEQYAFLLDVKTPALRTLQGRNRDYFTLDRISDIFKTQPKWPEVKGDIAQSNLESAPHLNFDPLTQYLMQFACRKVDPAALREAAHARAGH